MSNWRYYRPVGKEGAGRRQHPPPPSPTPPPPFPGVKKFFFLVKSENKIFTCENLRDLNLFIEQDISDKKETAFSEFFALAVN